jgi:pyridoxal phosphate enzyme (YggS family)
LNAVALGTIPANVWTVRDRVERACTRARRDPASVTLIAVSKTQDAEAVRMAFGAGIRDFGENRVQEALTKQGDVRGTVRWHMIGHLQTNKAKAAAGRFAIIHGIDSERLLALVAESAPNQQAIMLEVNVSVETTKYGVSPGAVPALVKAARSHPNIFLEGLMTVAPRYDHPDQARLVFRCLRQLAEEHGLSHLSMGMTDDFEVAIEEGATHIRVGRAIFGERTI